MSVDEVQRSHKTVLSETTITLRSQWGGMSRTVEIEIAVPYVFEDSEADYALGLGAYASSQNEFDTPVPKTLRMRPRLCPSK